MKHMNNKGGVIQTLFHLSLESYVELLWDSIEACYRIYQCRS